MVPSRRLRRDGWGAGGGAVAPGGLAAGIGAVPAPAGAGERGAADGAARGRVVTGIVTRRGHSGCPGEAAGGAVECRVVGDAVEPAAVDDADPGAGQDADGVRVVLAAGPGGCVDLGGPGAGGAAVVGEGGHGLAESLVAGPAEVDGAVLAGGLGDRCHAGQGSDRQVLIAFGLTGTTGCPASSSTSASRPFGRSIATGMPAGSPSRARTAISRASPSAVCATGNAATCRPPGSSTHTAWISEDQSIPTKNSASGSASDTVSPHGGSDDPARRLATGRSLTGALRRVLLLPVHSPARTGGGGVTVAVFRRPTQAITPWRRILGRGGRAVHTCRHGLLPAAAPRPGAYGPGRSRHYRPPGRIPDRRASSAGPSVAKGNIDLPDKLLAISPPSYVVLNELDERWHATS